MGFHPGSQDLAHPWAAPLRQSSPLGSRAELSANEGEHTQRGGIIGIHRKSKFSAVCFASQPWVCIPFIPYFYCKHKALAASQPRAGVMDPAGKGQASHVSPAPRKSAIWCLAKKQDTGTTNSLTAMAQGLLLLLKPAPGLLSAHRMEREREIQSWKTF